MSTVSRDGTRLETISSDDQGANLWIITLICLSFSIAVISARTLSKIKVGFKITADDFVIAGALVSIPVDSEAPFGLRLVGAYYFTLFVDDESFGVGTWQERRSCGFNKRRANITSMPFSTLREDNI